MDLKSDEVRQNLIDAGCNEDTIARFLIVAGIRKD